MFPFFDRNVWIVTMFFFFFNVVSSIFAIALYETSANNDKAYH